MKDFLKPLLEKDDGTEIAGTNIEEDTEQKPTFDDILKDKEMQAEFDRRVSKGIKTALENERHRYEQLADERISEAERLSKMTEIEKAKYEQDKKEAEIKKREDDLTKRELMAEAKQALSEKNLPMKLAELLNYKDANTCHDSLSTVEATFNEAVELAVRDRLKGGKSLKEATNNNQDELDLEAMIYKSMKG